MNTHSEVRRLPFALTFLRAMNLMGLLIFAGVFCLAVPQARASSVYTTWTNSTSNQVATVTVQSQSVGDASASTLVWSNWTTSSTTVQPGSSFSYESEGYAIIMVNGYTPKTVQVYRANVASVVYVSLETWTMKYGPAKTAVVTSTSQSAWSPSASGYCSHQSVTQTATVQPYGYYPADTWEQSNLGNIRNYAVNGYQSATIPLPSSTVSQTVTGTGSHSYSSGTSYGSWSSYSVDSYGSWSTGSWSPSASGYCPHQTVAQTRTNTRSNSVSRYRTVTSYSYCVNDSSSTKVGSSSSTDYDYSTQSDSATQSQTVTGTGSHSYVSGSTTGAWSAWSVDSYGTWSYGTWAPASSGYCPHQTVAQTRTNTRTNTQTRTQTVTSFQTCSYDSTNAQVNITSTTNTGTQSVADSASESQSVAGTGAHVFASNDTPGAWSATGTWTPPASDYYTDQTFTQTRATHRWHDTSDYCTNDALKALSNIGGFWETGSESQVISGAKSRIPAVSLSVVASAVSGEPPLTTTISWTTTNADTATITGSGLSATSLSGSKAVVLAEGTYSYVLTATNAGGSDSQTLTVTVARAPVTLTVGLKTGTLAAAGSVGGGGTFLRGDTAHPTVAVSSGYYFNGWSGDYVGTDVSPAIIMTGNKGIAAEILPKTKDVISWPNPGDQVIESGTPKAMVLGATTQSGLAVVYTLVSGPATLSGSVLTLTGTAGTVVLSAVQPVETATRLASDAVSLSFVVTVIPPRKTITTSDGSKTTTTSDASADGAVSVVTAPKVSGTKGN